MEYLRYIITIQALVATLLLVITLLVIRYKWWPYVFKRAVQKKLMEKGIEAEAIVLDIQPTGLYIDNTPQSKIQVQVQPDKGRNFVTEVEQALPDIYFGAIHPGSRIIVKYNPQNHKEIVLLRAA